MGNVNLPKVWWWAISIVWEAKIALPCPMVATALILIILANVEYREVAITSTVFNVIVISIIFVRFNFEWLTYKGFEYKEISNFRGSTLFFNFSLRKRVENISTTVLTGTFHIDSIHTDGILVR